MANNRLYIGDTKTKEYLFIEKGWGSGWDGGWFNHEAIKEFLKTRFGEGEVGTSTNLVFFTEYDKIHDMFIKEGEQWKTNFDPDIECDLTKGTIDIKR